MARTSSPPACSQRTALADALRAQSEIAPLIEFLQLLRQDSDGAVLFLHPACSGEFRYCPGRRQDGMRCFAWVAGQPAWRRVR